MNKKNSNNDYRHSVRDEAGRFTTASSRKAARSTTTTRSRAKAKAAPKTRRAATRSESPQIRNGRAYDLNGITVTALASTSNGMRLVTVDNTLFGFAHNADLRSVGSSR